LPRCPASDDLSRHFLALHSFPTRRSSDLGPLLPAEAGPPQLQLAVPGRHARGLPGEARDDQDEGGHRPGKGGRNRLPVGGVRRRDRKSTRLNSSHVKTSYAVFCLKKKTNS